MINKILEVREKSNLRFKLILNIFPKGSFNYSVIEELIKGNNLLPNNAELSRDVFDTLRKAKNELNRQAKDWFIIPIQKDEHAQNGIAVLI